MQTTISDYDDTGDTHADRQRIPRIRALLDELESSLD